MIEATFTRRYRIMYLSETAAGTPTVVTGLVELPEDLAPFGGLKALLYGHGTPGSTIPAHRRWSSTTRRGGDYADEFDSMSTAVNDGWAVIATDYEGLGGPGSHPLLVGVSEARSMLDAGRAARQLPVAYIGDTTAVFGYLAGRPRGPVGDAARRRMDAGAADHRHRCSGDPERSPIARCGGALAATTGGRRGGRARRSGDSERRGGNRVDAVAHTSGHGAPRLWDTQCFDVDPAVAGPYVTGDPSTVEPFATLLAANTAGTVPRQRRCCCSTATPTPTVPIAHNDTLVARLCATGQVVERRVVAGASHGTTIAQARPRRLAWLTGLAAGTTSPTSTCTP